MTHPAEQFLAALGKERATFQLFPDSEKAAEEHFRGKWVVHGPHHAQARHLAEANAHGMGVFVMVNHGDLQGRRATNVTGIAAYFVDLDGAPLPDVWPAEATIVVESSPGRYHAYWRVENASTDDFERVQKHLALLMGSDPVVHDLPRVMRLPGYQHQKREPFETRIMHEGDAAYTHDDFAERIAVPAPPPPINPAIAAYKRRRQAVKRGKNRDPLETATTRIATTREGNRNHTLYRVSCAVVNDITTGKVQRDEAEHHLVTAGVDAGLPEFEARRTVQSALRYAQ